MNFTDDQLTELECVIDAYIREAIRDYDYMLADQLTLCGQVCCPLAAVVISRTANDPNLQDMDESRILRRAFKLLKLSDVQAVDSFTSGFDGAHLGLFVRPRDEQLFHMGSRFRERWLDGEYERGWLVRETKA